jgi:hypothetical protein
LGIHKSKIICSVEIFPWQLRCPIPQICSQKLHVILNPAYIPETRAVCNAADHGLINYIDTKAKCCHLKKLTYKETLRQVFICLRPPSLVGICVGLSSNFVGFESGQIHSVKLQKNMVSCRTQHHPPPPSHTLSVYTHYTVLDTGKGGRGGDVNQREGLRDNSSQSWVENTNMTDCLSSL